MTPTRNVVLVASVQKTLMFQPLPSAEAVVSRLPAVRLWAKRAVDRFGRRAFLLDEIRARKALPITLLVVLYLLDALVSTAFNAASDAELLMTGLSDNSIAVTFTPASGVEHPPAGDMLLVAIRNGHYFVVE